MKDSRNVYSFFNKTHNYLHQSFGISVRSDIVKELIGKPMNKSFLDIGCGNGAISSQYLVENQITFLDLSENMIDLARQGVPLEWSSRASYRVGSFTELKLDHVYDYIFAIGVLAHVPSVKNTLKRMHELLQREGSAVIQFSDYRHWLTRHSIRNSSHYGYSVNRMEYEDMKSYVEGAGFSIDREVRFSFLLPGMGKLPQKILYRYASAIWKSRHLSNLGTDYMWLLRKARAE